MQNYVPHTGCRVLLTQWGPELTQGHPQRWASDTSYLRQRTSRRHSRKPTFKKSCWRESTEHFCLLACFSLWTTWNPHTKVRICRLCNPSHATPNRIPCSIVLWPLRWMGSLRTQLKLLDSCRHESSCNMWCLGRGVGLELGKLFWDHFPHERYPSITASSWCSCTTQADNWKRVGSWIK